MSFKKFLLERDFVLGDSDCEDDVEEIGKVSKYPVGCYAPNGGALTLEFKINGRWYAYILDGVEGWSFRKTDVLELAQEYWSEFSEK